MASTVFTNNVTLTDADWFNDLNRLHYAILGDPADAAAVKTALGAAASGANADITSLSALTSINGGQIAGFRNKIINGDMRIDQRNAGAAVTPTASTYLVDRFLFASSQASKLTFQQVADAPRGFKFSTKITVASQFAPAAGDSFTYVQPIEGQNVIDLAFGTASAASITVSFYAKTSVAGTYSVSIRNVASDRSYVFSVTLTTSWARYTVTIPGDATGTWATGNATGLSVGFSLGVGTTYQTASPNRWLAGSYLAATGSTQFVNQTAGATLNITGVQLEAGTVATPFENRPVGTEVALCQRYYEKSYALGTAPATVTNTNMVQEWVVAGQGEYQSSGVRFTQDKRAAPTVTIYSSTTGASGVAAATSAAADKTAALEGTGTRGATLYFGLAAADLMRYHWTASAEL